VLRPIQDGPMHKPCRNVKEGSGDYPGVGGEMLRHVLLAVCECSVCKGERREIAP